MKLNRLCLAYIALLLCVQGAEAEESSSKLSKLNKFKSVVTKAKQSAGTMSTVKDFAKKVGAIKSVKAIPSKKDKKLAVNIARTRASHMNLNQVEKFGVKVSSLDFARNIAFKAGGSKSKLGLDDIEGIGLGLNIGGLPTSINVSQAGLKKDELGKLHFLTTVVHQNIPKPLPIDIPL